MKKILIYDFDGTLTTRPIPRFEILERCGFPNGLENPQFNKLVAEKMSLGCDNYEAFFFTYLDAIKKNGYVANDESFCIGVQNIEYQKGVPYFLDFVKKQGFSNYLLSSGIKVYLQNTSVAKYFDDIYATEFNYDNGLVTSVKYSMSDKKKVEAIKDICLRNGLDDCKSIIYVGDGLTDYYAMEYVKRNGGRVIFIKSNSTDDLTNMRGVVDLFTNGDYSSDSEIVRYIKEIK